MSRLDELIEKLCPDGAEFLTLQECTKKVKNIKWKSYSGNDKKYIDLSSVDRDLHCIMETQNINSDAAPSRAQQIVQTDDILLGTTRPMLKRYCMIPEKYDDEVCSTGFCVLRANTEIVLPRWIYHNIATTDFFAYVEQNQKGASYPAISDASVKAFSLPVPPLEVQREIVRVLDSFTLLTAELTAELTARKKQYEFYRDKMLNFGNKAAVYKMSELCESIADGDHMPPPKSDEGIPFITISNVDEYHNIDFENTMYVPESYYNSLAEKRIPRKGNILYTVVGSYGIPVCIEDDKKFVFQRHIAILKPNNDIIKSRYMFHAMQSTNFKIQADKSAKGAAQKTIALSALGNMQMSVPSMDVQEKIIKVLDNFDAICTDLNIGLPAEIEARQKQYEYYRDLLLTFAEKGDMLLTDGRTDGRTDPIRAERN